jgi:subtilase family serine protease
MLGSVVYAQADPDPPALNPEEVYGILASCATCAEAPVELPTEEEGTDVSDEGGGADRSEPLLTGYCGNGYCGGGENCANCPADCGACPPMPDLTVNLTISGTHSPYTVTAVVRNIGDAAAGASTTKIRYTPWNPDDRYFPTPALAPGENYTITLTDASCHSDGRTLEAWADIYNDVWESDGSNNHKTIPVPRCKADLVVNVERSPGFSPYTVTATVSNIGDRDAHNFWTVFVYEGWPEESRFRWRYIHELEDGETRTYTFDDVYCMEHPEQFMAHVDVGDYVDEYEECNNYDDVTISMCKPDYISSITQTSAPDKVMFQIDGRLYFSVTTHNQGDGSGGISTTTVTDEGANELDTESIMPLAPGQGGTFYTWHTCEPDEMTTYYSHADALNVLDEHDEGNNDNSLTMWCPGTPDYVLSIVNVNNYTSEGQISFYVNTSNVGTAHSDSSSKTQVLINAGAIELNVPALAKHGEDLQYVAISCEPGTDVILGGNADYYNDISPEIDEYNNGAAEVIVGCPGPDYVVSIACTEQSEKNGDGPECLQEDRKLLLDITTTNIGNAAATGGSVTNVTLNGTYATEIVINDGLGVGEPFTAPVQLDCVPGLYYDIGAYADGLMQITELNETNNDDSMLGLLCPGKPDYVPTFEVVDNETSRQLTLRVVTTNMDEDAWNNSITRLLDGETILYEQNVSPLGPLSSTGFEYTVLNCTPGFDVELNAIVDAENALDESNELNNMASESFICPGSYTAPELATGWNLVSWPLTPSDNSTEWVFSFSPDVNLVWYLEGQNWYWYQPGVNASTLQETTRGKAYLVNMSEPGALTIYGTQEVSTTLNTTPPTSNPPFRIQINPEWNMLGMYANTSTMSINDIFGNKDYDALYTFNGGYNPAIGSTMIQLGSGFFMYSPEAAQYSPRT